MLTETDEIVVTSQQGQIFVLQRTQGHPKLQLSRFVDLAPENLLQGIPLLNAVYDADGNIWFTTGGLRGFDGVKAQPSTIVGYVEPGGVIHSMQIPNQMVENGISVRNSTIFMITGPSDKDDHVDAVGFITALRPGPGNSVSVVWNATYQAGSSKKPGLFSRGSGSTPTLLGDDFVAITDNADSQINLLVFHQKGASSEQPICKVHLFQPGASANDNGPIAHFDGQRLWSCTTKHVQ